MARRGGSRIRAKRVEELFLPYRVGGELQVVPLWSGKRPHRLKALLGLKEQYDLYGIRWKVEWKETDGNLQRQFQAGVVFGLDFISRFLGAIVDNASFDPEGLKKFGGAEGKRIYVGKIGGSYKCFANSRNGQYFGQIGFGYRDFPILLDPEDIEAMPDLLKFSLGPLVDSPLWGNQVYRMTINKGDLNRHNVPRPHCPLLQFDKDFICPNLLDWLLRQYFKEVMNAGYLRNLEYGKPR